MGELKQDKPLVGGMSSTGDWQKLARPIAVLPIGAFEQHGAHLPLLTDTLLVTYFAEHLARQLGAACLPTLPIGQSYEHTGFRGSLSLRPETIMAVVRDLVDELERQHFTRVVLLNGHGGNFALPTVVRDINRTDRPIKVILTSWAEHDQSTPHGETVGEVHAGAWETSVMMAIRGDLIGQPAPTAPPAIDGGRQSDLNTFGLGVLKPSGPWGEPSLANAAQGRRSAESIKENMLAHIRQRLRWLDEQPAYGGAGPIVTRPLTKEDIPAGVRLCRIAGWNQQQPDWTLLRRAAPEGCFAAVHNGKVVATATAVPYEARIGWIGMVLVDPTFRRRSIGTMLLNRACEALADCDLIKLDATPAGKKVYDTLGFIDEYSLSRMINRSVMAVPAPDNTVRPMTEADLEAVVDLDAEVFGANRNVLIRGLFEIAPEMAWVAVTDDTVTGSVLGRPGENFAQIGPVAAANLPTAKSLTASALANLSGRAVAIDATHHNPMWMDWLTDLGFELQRPFIRMYKGDNLHPGRTADQFAICGPEWG